MHFKLFCFHLIFPPCNGTHHQNCPKYGILPISHCSSTANKTHLHDSWKYGWCCLTSNPAVQYLCRVSELEQILYKINHRQPLSSVEQKLTYLSWTLHDGGQHSTSLSELYREWLYCTASISMQPETRSLSLFCPSLSRRSITTPSKLAPRIVICSSNRCCSAPRISDHFLQTL